MRYARCMKCVQMYSWIMIITNNNNKRIENTTKIETNAFVCLSKSRICLIFTLSFWIWDTFNQFQIPNICYLYCNWNFRFSEFRVSVLADDCCKNVRIFFWLWDIVTQISVWFKYWGNLASLLHFIKDSVYISVLFDIHGFNKCIWQHTFPKYFQTLKSPLSSDVRAYIVHCTCSGQILI